MLRRLTVNPREPDRAALDEAANALRRGGIVAYPTDTVYGLAVDPRSRAAVSRLFSAKGRQASAAVALIAADLTQARTAGEFHQRELALAERFWPGPLTIVVPASPALTPELAAGRGTMGVRVPDHAVARGLARAFGACITATSANRSGEPAAIDADAVAAALGDAIDVLLDAGPAPGGPPSTLVEIVDGRPTLHRAGAVAWERVLESVEW